MSSSSERSAAAPSVSFPLRHCLSHFATGVAIATYEANEGPRGLTVNSFTSVSLDPSLVLICIDKRSRAVDLLPRISFAVNVLDAGQRDLAWHFGGRPSSAIKVEWQRKGCLPLLWESLAWLVCKPWSNHDAGDHLIVVGEVVEFGTSDRSPLCFFRGKLIDLPLQSIEIPTSSNANRGV